MVDTACVIYVPTAMIIIRVDVDDEMTADEVTSTGAISLVLLHVLNATPSVNKLDMVVSAVTADR